VNRTLQYGNIPFGPYVMKTKVPEDMRKKLLKDGKKDLASYHKKLAGHLNTQLRYNDDTTKWFYRESHFIWQAYREGWSNFTGLTNEGVELSAHDLWVNFMKPGDFNPVHTHGGDYSFVIFLDVPEKLVKEQNEFEGTSAPPGSLMFEFTQQAKPKWAITGQSVKPRTGEMLIFPALLQHWVVPFKSKCTRVSVSGNLEIVNRKNLSNDFF
tara:strand:+ start:59 stop:691 length:633 start_codon:yes stop_codon:yes gene_type:complete